MSKSMHRQNVEQATAEHNAHLTTTLEPTYILTVSDGTHTVKNINDWTASSPPGTVAKRPRWQADIQHVLDALEHLGHVATISPVDGLPEHMVIELSSGGGWLYYDPDNGLRTLTSKQARHYLASEQERHVEEGVWA